MAIQYMDNSFEIGGYEEMRDKFFDLANEGFPMKAFHIGSREELQKRSDELPIKDRLDKLEAKINEIEIIRSDIIHIPNKGEVDNYGN